MARYLLRELDKIKKQILSLGAMVEDRVRMATKAIEDRDAATAQKIIDSDWEIDEMEVDVEEECLKILALHQPVAVDLRFIITAIKINNDLERIGDQAVNIAERVLNVSKRPDFGFVFDYSTMAEQTEAMLRMSLDALVNLDVDMAFKVITLDDEVDAIKTAAYDRIKKAIKKNPDRVGSLINLLLISRHLERLADHATNIAEEVIYLIEGEIVRHGKY
ncbi:MAG: phosphate signaling complex protein PhoU [Desulfobacteraceae bacterium]|jgi:phosphate transport system protein